MTTTTIRKNLNTYRIAFPLDSGNLDVVEEFCVANDDAATSNESVTDSINGVLPVVALKKEFDCP